ncbi:hypothetical protein PSACC_03588 [Paramicrosporidium saccamoebae]|uniref:Uncharacterized protein n=1 Tax=Paramicrosporidium saccamoebae TaxID=1246581 RepID=A0A2H9TFV1_9FUNG|nr:hypothetical protein PSACC_03588 [Paramicrosporidium saccamoebae]
MLSIETEPYEEVSPGTSSIASEIGKAHEQPKSTLVDSIAEEDIAIEESLNKRPAVIMKRRPSTPALIKPFLALVRNTGVMSTVYNISGRGNLAHLKIVTRDVNGYRYHPSTIRDLMEYQQRCTSNTKMPPELVIRLVARLLQDW